MKPGVPDENGIAVGQNVKIDVRKLADREEDLFLVEPYDEAREMVGVVQYLPPKNDGPVRLVEVMLLTTQQR